MIKNQLEIYSEKINNRLEQLLNAQTSGYQRQCIDAMRYSLSAGGKRLRPVLVLEFARIFGKNDDTALDTACAIEMIHTFSLIHDDLPCMDDDDIRRGKPSCHKAFSEAIALLAGDALENLAFDVISKDNKLSDHQKVMLIRELSFAVGVDGMIGGQIIDIDNINNPFDSDKLLKMYSMKTGALIKCACRMGCICADRPDMIDTADRYAESLGLAFQIIDDILDIIADEKLLGKPVHSDEALNKSTYPAVLGIENARIKAKELSLDAMKTASEFDVSGFLTELTEYLLKRAF